MDPTTLGLIVGILGLVLAAIAVPPAIEWLQLKLRPPEPKPDPSQKAIEDLTEAVESLRKSNEELTEKLGEVFNHGVGLPQRAATERLVAAATQVMGEAAELAAAGKYVEAARLMEGTLKTAPSIDLEGTLHFYIGNAWYHASLQEEAAHQYDARRERLEAARGHWSEAANLARQAGNSEAEAAALNNKGVALGNLGRHPEALAAYDRALALRPDHPDTLMNKGNALVRLGRLPEALEAYDRALALRPDHPDTLMNKGVALAGLGRHPEALVAYDRSLALRPDHPDTLMNKGNALADLGRLPEALAAFDRALALFEAAGDTEKAALVRENLAQLREVLLKEG